MQELAIPVLAALATGAVVMAIAAYFSGSQAHERLERLRGKRETPRPAVAPSRSLLARPDHGILGRLLIQVGERGDRSAADSSMLRERLIHAGYRQPSAVPIYLGIRAVAALSLPALSLLIPIVWTLPQYQLFVLLAWAAGVGYVIPSWWIDRRRASVRGQIERALPDSLDLMVVCVEAGLGINASMDRVSNEFAESSPLIANEFSLAVHETQAGKTTTEALRRMADRTAVADISALVALLVQTERFGTSLTDALRVHADAMRVRRMQRAEERAQLAPLKMLLPTMMIFAGLLLIFLAPGVSMFNKVFDEI